MPIVFASVPTRSKTLHSGLESLYLWAFVAWRIFEKIVKVFFRNDLISFDHSRRCDR